jgi:hypothetical protein
LQKLTRNEELEDDKGKRLPAKRVFAMVIRYLKDDLLKETEKKLTEELKEEEIQWVLTVPAIWTPPAKQFMRECAIEVNKFLFLKKSVFLFNLTSKLKNKVVFSLFRVIAFYTFF